MLVSGFRKESLWLESELLSTKHMQDDRLRYADGLKKKPLK